MGSKWYLDGTFLWGSFFKLAHSRLLSLDLPTERPNLTNLIKLILIKFICFLGSNYDDLTGYKLWIIDILLKSCG